MMFMYYFFSVRLEKLKYCPYLGADTLVEVFFNSVNDSHGLLSSIFAVGVLFGS